MVTVKEDLEDLQQQRSEAERARRVAKVAAKPRVATFSLATEHEDAGKEPPVDHEGPAADMSDVEGIATDGGGFVSAPEAGTGEWQTVTRGRRGGRAGSRRRSRSRSVERG